MPIAMVSFPSVSIPNYFIKLPTCIHNLIKTSIIHKPRLKAKGKKTSFNQKFYSLYRFHFDCSKNGRKRPLCICITCLQF